MENVSICQLLFHREIGYRHNKDRINKVKLTETAYYLAEDTLLNCINKNDKLIKSVSQITNDFRSIFTIEYSQDGKVATSHTNRSVSIFKVSNMKLVAKIETNDRTIWTMSFHPIDSKILATGSLGGSVSVYKDYKLYRQSREISRKPVASMSFHPTEFYICLATSKRLILWDWEHSNNVIAVFETHPLCTIRYIRFNTNDNSLITGISKIPNNLIFLSRDRNFLQYFVPKSYINLGYFWIFLLTTNYMLEYFELNKFCNSEKIQANSNTWNFVMKLIAEQTELDSDVNERKDVDENSDELQERSLNETLKMFVNRLEEIEEDIRETMDLKEKLQFPDNEMIRKSIENYLNYFSLVNNSIVQDKQNLTYKLTYDLKLVEKVIKNMYKILFILCDDKSVFQHNVDHYMRGEMMKPILVERSENFESQYTLQLWSEIGNIDLTEDWRNVIGTATVHNDSTISISNCGKYIASFKTTMQYKCIEVRSLEKATLGELKYVFKTNNENFLSLSISASTKFLLIGIRSKLHFAHVLNMGKDKNMKVVHSLPNYKNEPNTINCLKWSLVPSDGIIIGYRLYQMRYIRNF